MVRVPPYTRKLKVYINMVNTFEIEPSYIETILNRINSERKLPQSMVRLFATRASSRFFEIDI